uniref:T cell activation inhibitor, mitochondrial n=1 Tax=Ornithorhynchus anatinus TaxID=9258 RepID=A0A6I8N3J1_ORNAN
MINGCFEVGLHIHPEMFCYLRPVRRFCLEKILPQWFIRSRALSGAEAVNALRPFYFAVHPDFFGQHPREREVNENSLKKLSVYLESIQKPGIKSLKPTQLTFYVRETEQNSSESQESFSISGFRAVSFTLHNRDLLSTVLDILNACSLSSEHVQTLSANASSQPRKESKNTFYRTIKWDKTYYSFTGFKDPEEELEQAQRVETTLISWLGNNEKSAIKKLKNSLPLRGELDRLKDELSHQLQLSDIRWQRSWGIAHRCSQLHSLSRLAQQNLETLKNAKGRTVMFTDRSGMSAVGHVMLGTMDVHHHWTEIFERLPSYYDLQRKLMLLEDQISQLLGGMQVVYIEELQPLLTIEEYYPIIECFYHRLISSRIPFHPRSLRGLQMILDKLMLMENDLISTSTEKFSLKKLYKEPSVSSAQMVDCCKRLLEQSLPYLQGMHLCISHFYSVMQDGDLCIPWNWKRKIIFFLTPSFFSYLELTVRRPPSINEFGTVVFST